MNPYAKVVSFPRPHLVSFQTPVDNRMPVSVKTSDNHRYYLAYDQVCSLMPEINTKSALSFWELVLIAQVLP
jgi:hypothetical protein